MLLNNAHIAPLIWWDHDWLRFSGCWPAIAKGASGVIICFDSAVHNQDVVDKWYEWLLRRPVFSTSHPCSLCHIARACCACAGATV